MNEKLYIDMNYSSQVFSQIVYLIQDEVQVLHADLRADDHHPEKIGLVTVGLVAHHHTALLHHALFHHRSHLQEEGGYTVRTYYCLTQYSCLLLLLCAYSVVTLPSVR